MLKYPKKVCKNRTIFIILVCFYTWVCRHITLNKLVCRELKKVENRCHRVSRKLFGWFLTETYKRLFSSHSLETQAFRWIPAGAGPPPPPQYGTPVGNQVNWVRKQALTFTLGQGPIRFLVSLRPVFFDLGSSEPTGSANSLLGSLNF